MVLRKSVAIGLRFSVDREFIHANQLRIRGCLQLSNFLSAIHYDGENDYGQTTRCNANNCLSVH